MTSCLVENLRSDEVAQYTAIYVSKNSLNSQNKSKKNMGHDFHFQHIYYQELEESIQIMYLHSDIKLHAYLN